MRLLLTTMFVFCVVGCVADEPGATEASDVALASETEGTSASALISVEPGEPDPGELSELPDVTTSAFTLTFLATCNGESVRLNAAGTAVIAASAASCRRRNGTLTGRVSWSGVCRGDIANCNGVLRCGRC